MRTSSGNGDTGHKADGLPVKMAVSSQIFSETRILYGSSDHASQGEFCPQAKVHSVIPFLKRRWSLLAHGHIQSQVGPSQQDSRRRAWQGGLRWATIGASSILLLNLILLFVSLHFADAGIVTLYHGSCSTVSSLNSGLHVLINILSTIFISASNYVMQLLNAPSRKQLDYYHARGRSLDIGIPSIKNVFMLERRRVILWLFLGISAIPLHLFWNSVVFQTLQANDYKIFLVSSDFNSTKFSCNDNDSCDLAQNAYNLAKSFGELDYMETSECFTTYGVNFLTGRRNLILVGNTTDVQFTNGTTALNGSLFRVLNSSLWLRYLATQTENPMWEPNYWWCGSSRGDPAWVTGSWNDIVNLQIHDPDDGSSFSDMTECSISQAKAHAGELQYMTTVNNSDTVPWGIEYGLSEPVPENCQLGFAVYIMAVVIACNIVKVSSMIASFWILDDDPIVVIGDALASFLEEPDEVTNGFCLMEARSSLLDRQTEGTVWRSERRFWFDAASPFSIFRCMICCFAALAAAAYLLWLSLQNLSNTNKSFSSTEFAGVDPSTMIQSLMPPTIDQASFRALALAVFVANSPQLVYSTLYFMYNRLLTAMLAMDEWTRFQHRATTLRTSYPDRGQRSTYWLHLPYTYSIPLLIITSIMHWLLSQSIFLARIAIFDAYGNPVQGTRDAETPGVVTDVGYSPKAIAATIAVGSAMVLFLIGWGFRRYRTGIPLVGSNSLALSAACHPPEDDYDPAHSLLKWGAIDHGDETKPGKCFLTSKPVTEPIVGRRYA